MMSIPQSYTVRSTQPLTNCNMATASSSLPEGYTLLRRVGQGSQAVVHFGVPTATIVAARHRITHGVARGVIRDALRSVVAVKISRGVSLRREIETLNAIQDQSNKHKGAQRCAQILDWDRNARHPLWVVTSTTPMFDAFWFLQRVCEPPIAHQDFGLYNVIVSLPDTTSTGPPKLTLIDFGDADFIPPLNTKENADLTQYEVTSFGYDIALSCKDIVGCPADELSFLAQEKLRRFMRIYGEVTNLEQLWAELGGFAEQQLEMVGKEDWVMIKTLLLRAVGTMDARNGGPSDAVEIILGRKDRRQSSSSLL
ncbi:hypothetical protein NX059_001064 [Plenodomus lindquistii]|nr:hypothetical protein NX059_001064 [Plenodomus lindquistii]